MSLRACGKQFPLLCNVIASDEKERSNPLSRCHCKRSGAIHYPDVIASGAKQSPLLHHVIARSREAATKQSPSKWITLPDKLFPFNWRHLHLAQVQVLLRSAPNDIWTADCFAPCSRLQWHVRIFHQTNLSTQDSNYWSNQFSSGVNRPWSAFLL